VLLRTSHLSEYNIKVKGVDSVDPIQRLQAKCTLRELRLLLLVTVTAENSPVQAICRITERCLTNV